MRLAWHWFSQFYIAVNSLSFVFLDCWSVTLFNLKTKMAIGVQRDSSQKVQKMKNLASIFCVKHTAFWSDTARRSVKKNTSLIRYPSSCYVFCGIGGRLRHVGVAIGSIKEAKGWRGAVGGFGEGDQVWVCLASEHEAAERVTMGQDHHGLHQLSQRPALLTRLQQRLDTTERKCVIVRLSCCIPFANQHARTSKDLYDELIIPMKLKMPRLPYLDVRAGSEPRLVGQHLVNVV